MEADHQGAIYDDGGDLHHSVFLHQLPHVGRVLDDVFRLVDDAVLGEEPLRLYTLRSILLFGVEDYFLGLGHSGLLAASGLAYIVAGGRLVIVSVVVLVAVIAVGLGPVDFGDAVRDVY